MVTLCINCCYNRVEHLDYSDVNYCNHYSTIFREFVEGNKQIDSNKAKNMQKNNKGNCSGYLDERIALQRVRNIKKIRKCK